MWAMRFLVKATLPVEAGNALVRDPNFGQRIQDILGDIRPEAVYFAAADGQRTVYAVVNLQDTHEIPRIAEPFWLALKANVEIIPAMAQDDFAQAAPLIEQAAKKYR
jgi:hypothetical protein